MRKASCQDCGSQQPLGGMFRLNGRTLCEPCADKSIAQLKASGQDVHIAHESDPTICAKCATDYGYDLPPVGSAPFCQNCSQELYTRGFPGWLNASMVLLLLGLGIALWHGARYFKAGRHLVLAERAMDRHYYRTARTNFAEVLKVGPTEQKVILLAAKACILSDDLECAGSALNRRQEYKRDELFDEVNGLWKRAIAAYKKAEQAGKLEEQKRHDEAADLMHQAAQEFPESLILAIGAEASGGGAAFERKDYDGFLAHSETALAKDPKNAGSIGRVASALAAKYAATGDPSFRTRAEEMLAQAQDLARTPEEKASYTEYSERIRYRLETRQIIDKGEYDRRFRQTKGTK